MIYDVVSKSLFGCHPSHWLGLPGLDDNNQAPVEIVDCDLSTVSTAADCVLHVLAPDPYLVHFEMQTSYERFLPRRILRYNVLLNGRYSLPVRSVLVLMRPGANHAELTGLDRHCMPGGESYLDFRYQVVRLWQQPVELFLSGGLGILPLAPLVKDAERQMPEIVRRMDERIRQEASPQTAHELWTSTLVLMGLRYPDEIVEKLLQGVHDMQDSVTYQAILAKGAINGKAEGMRELILRLGRIRFGLPDEAIARRLESISDLYKLEHLADRILQASSWAELLPLA